MTDATPGPEGPQTAAGRQAADDKAAARAKLAAAAQTAQADQEEAAAAEKRRQQTEAAREARARSRGNHVEPPAPQVDDIPAAELVEEPCEPCRQLWELTDQRLRRIEFAVGVGARILVGAAAAAAVLYVLGGLGDRRAVEAEAFE